MPDPIFYLHDPLCGWCYGAAPVIHRLEQEGVAIVPVPTGLFAGPNGRIMDSAFASFVWTADQRIAAVSGQRFTQAYRTHVLDGAIGTPLDSRAATLALTAVARSEPAREFAAMRLIQEARYVAGRDIVAMPSVIAILAEAGFTAAAASLAAPDAALEAANRDRVARGRALMAAVGAQGVPALVVPDGTGFRSIRNDVLYGSADPLLALLKAA